MPEESAEWSIGAVSFGRPITEEDKEAYRRKYGRETTRTWTWIDTGSIGPVRIDLLRKLYRGEALPDGIFAVAGSGSQGYRPIDRSAVNWDTAGERVTGPKGGKRI